MTKTPEQIDRDIQTFLNLLAIVCAIQSCIENTLDTCRLLAEHELIRLERQP